MIEVPRDTMAAVKALKKVLRKELAERLKLVTSDVAQSECNVHSSLIMRPVAINLT
jgi:hypothetical protein